MDNKTKKLLFDMLTSINNIESYIGEEKIFEDYNSNPMLQDAVERNIEIIPKLSDSTEMRSAKRLRIKSLQKTQEYPAGLASIFESLFNSTS